jgi:hypothetical protein
MHSIFRYGPQRIAQPVKHRSNMCETLTITVLYLLAYSTVHVQQIFEGTDRTHEEKNRPFFLTDFSVSLFDFNLQLNVKHSSLKN